MKGPNGKSVLLNRATVSISSSVYDRRALDCTDNKALVNSLNHLTFLTSTSVKVRDAMILDGAIERLIEILYECHDPKNNSDNILFAWKWVLSLQCLVLAGTRGSEKMRKKLVDAGIIPLLATILDNHFLTRKNLHNNNNNNTTTTNKHDTYNTNNTQPLNSPNLSHTDNHNNHPTHNDINPLDTDIIINNNEVEDPQISNVFRQIRNSVHDADDVMLEANDEIDKLLNNSRNNSDSLIISKPLAEEEIELLNVIELAKCFQKLSDNDINNTNLEFVNNNFKDIIGDFMSSNELFQRLEVSNLLYPQLDPFNSYLGGLKALVPINQSVPRSFENGLILPVADDVIWSLQLLAFISKYTYLRIPLSSTYLINGLSFRSRNHPPPLEVDNNNNNDIDVDDLINESSNDELSGFPYDNDNINNNNNSNVNTNTNNNSNNILTNNNQPIAPISDLNMYTCKMKEQERLKNLQKLSDNNDKNIVSDYFKIIESDDKFEKIKITEKIRLNTTKLKYESLGKLRNKNKRLYREKLKNYSNKWDYNNSWDEFETPVEKSKLIDNNIQPFVTLNIFPLVERFTVKSLFPDDICYWAAVVVRNANRRDDKMGGRRQCANFSCGKWEDHPKQFSKCRRCKRAKYCSRECQTKAWVFHKHWCVPANNPITQTSGGNNTDGNGNGNNNNVEGSTNNEATNTTNNTTDGDGDNDEVNNASSGILSYNRDE